MGTIFSNISVSDLTTIKGLINVKLSVSSDRCANEQHEMRLVQLDVRPHMPGYIYIGSHSVDRARNGFTLRSVLGDLHHSHPLRYLCGK